MRDHDFEDLRLWTLQGNSSARTFYERHGWWHDDRGEAKTVPGGPYVEVRYPAR